MRFIKGRLAIISFRDHSIGSRGHSLTKCRIFGRIYKINKYDMIVNIWELVNPGNKQTFIDNVEKVRLLKSTVYKIKYFKGE